MSETTDSSKPSRDEVYYWDNVSFIVEQVVFKAPKWYFEINSGIFNNVFDPSLEGVKLADEGSNIQLESLLKIDFERLLKLMYPKNGHRPEDMDRLEWESVLRLSTMFKWPHIRKMAIEELAKLSLDPVDNMLLGHTYGIESWFISGCENLATRKMTLSVQEGRRLGVDHLARLCEIREVLMNARYDNRANQGGIEVSGAEATSALDQPQTVSAATWGWPSDQGAKIEPENIEAPAVETTPVDGHIRHLFIKEIEEICEIDSSGLSSLVSIRSDSPNIKIFHMAQHEDFYMESLVFLVEDILFKVPKRCFEHKGVFDTIFSLPSAEGAAIDGSDDEHPFRLDGISAADFRRFLEVLYPSDLPSRWKNVTSERWLSVLKLSSMWDFPELRKMAVDELSKIPMNSLPKIMLARKYSISNWLLTGYQDLVKRSAAVTLKEAKELGWETAILIFQIREEEFAKISVRKGLLKKKKAGQVDRGSIECQENVAVVFAAELSGMT